MAAVSAAISPKTPSAITAKRDINITAGTGGADANLSNLAQGGSGGNLNLNSDPIALNAGGTATLIAGTGGQGSGGRRRHGRRDKLCWQRHFHKNALIIRTGNGGADLNGGLGGDGGQINANKISSDGLLTVITGSGGTGSGSGGGAGGSINIGGTAYATSALILTAGNGGADTGSSGNAGGGGQGGYLNLSNVNSGSTITLTSGSGGTG